MATKAKRHVHKYYRSWNASHTEFLWTCGLPDCPHHMPKHYEQTLNGKSTLCWNYGRNPDCEVSTILDERTMKMDKPVCLSCDADAIAVSTLDNDTIDKLKEIGVLGKLD